MPPAPRRGTDNPPQARISCCTLAVGFLLGSLAAAVWQEFDFSTLVDLVRPIKSKAGLLTGGTGPHQSVIASKRLDASAREEQMKLLAKTLAEKQKAKVKALSTASTEQKKEGDQTSTSRALEAPTLIQDGPSTSWVLEVPTTTTQDGSTGDACQLQFKYSSHILRRRQLAQALKESVSYDSYIPCVKQYAELYLEEYAKRDALYPLHVSKSGGTSICGCAMLNGCKGTNKSDNCHSIYGAPLWNGGGNDNVIPPVLSTCDHFAAWMKASGATMEANEHYLPREGTCHHFWNVMVFRDPVDRLLAHLADLYGKCSTVGNGCDADFTKKIFWDQNLTPQSIFKRPTFRLADNYYIRSLLGSHVFGLVFDKIDRLHLEQAKKKLHGFDVVMTLDSSFTHLTQLLFGFSCAVHSRIRADNLSARLRHRWQAGPEMDELKAQNQLDLELFEYTKELSMLDRLVYDHPTFQHVVTSSRCSGNYCLDDECGYLKKYFPGIRRRRDHVVKEGERSYAATPEYQVILERKKKEELERRKKEREEKAALAKANADKKRAEKAEKAKAETERARQRWLERNGQAEG